MKCLQCGKKFKQGPLEESFCSSVCAIKALHEASPETKRINAFAPKPIQTGDEGYFFFTTVVFLGLFVLVAFALIGTAKLFDLITWSWWWVCSPLIGFGIVAGAFLGLKGLAKLIKGK